MTILYCGALLVRAVALALETSFVVTFTILLVVVMVSTILGGPAVHGHHTTFG